MPVFHFDAPARRPANPTSVQVAAELLRTAKRPLIWSGHGVIQAGASQELTKLAEVNMGELGTAVQEGVNLVIVLFNDGGYGILRNIQDRVFEGRHVGVDLYGLSFEKLSAAYGIAYYPVTSLAEFRPAVESALAGGQLSLVEVDMQAVGPFRMPFAGFEADREDGTARYTYQCPTRSCSSAMRDSSGHTTSMRSKLATASWKYSSLLSAFAPSIPAVHRWMVLSRLRSFALSEESVII